MADIRGKYLGEFRELLCDKQGNLLTGASVGQWLKTTIAKDGTISTPINLGGNFAYLQVIIPALDSATLTLQGSLDGQTFQDLGQVVITTAGTGSFNDAWVLGGWEFIKIKASAGQTTAARVFWVRGVTY